MRKIFTQGLFVMQVETIAIEHKHYPASVLVGHEDMRAIGQRLRAARVAKGYMSATMPAKDMRIAASTLLDHETAVRGMNSLVLKRYARYYGVSVEWLLFGDQR